MSNLLYAYVPTRDKWMCNGLVNKSVTLSLLGKLKD